MKFARLVFRVAGIYGVLILAPQYFMEQRIGIETPPPITHPEHFYGFVGVALAWQIVYLLISTDPARYRPIMLVGVLAKCSFGFAAIVLYAQQRLAGQVVAAASVDLVLAALFAAAFLATRARVPA